MSQDPHLEVLDRLHTNKDLYKWVFKMHPRTETVRIETDEGRLQYVKLQTKMYQKSVPLRNALIKQYITLIKSVCDKNVADQS